MDYSAKKQIRNLLSVIFLAVICGFFLLGFFIYNYGPSGRYTVKDALLSPELATTLNYNDTNAKTGGMSRFLFDGIEFTYLDRTEKKMKTITIDPEVYQQFYQLIVSDKSLLDPSEEVIKAFNKSHAELKINVRTESHAEWQDMKKVFQELHLQTDGNYYRIELHEQQTPNSSKWIYYLHPDIYNKALAILTAQQGRPQ